MLMPSSKAFLKASSELHSPSSKLVDEIVLVNELVYNCAC